MALEHKFIVQGVSDYHIKGDNMEIWAQEMGDEYHTIHELYQHRMALTIALFHYMHKVHQSILGEKGADVYPIVFKSRLHNDGTMFDGGYFIVMAITPEGQISYHYELKHWDAFRIPELERAPVYDGHTSSQVLDRLMKI